MADRTIGAKVKLDGEKEFKQAISEINSGLGILGSEMRKVSAEYQDNSRSVEALTAKGDVLERTLLSQKEKVEELQRALEHAKQQYGEADERTQNWEKSLNNAETAVINTEHAIEENNKALEAAKAGSLGLGTALDSMADKFGVKIPRSAKKALDSITSVNAGLAAGFAGSAAIIAAVVNQAEKLHEITVQAAHDADEIITTSMTTGLGTQTLQQLKYAENLIDVSVNTISGSLTRLTRNMSAANDGNKDMIKNFSKLGVSITDANGHLRNAEDVFYDVINALGSVNNSTERDALAMDVLGKSAQELNPLILQGSAALKAYADEAEKTGYVLDEYQLARLGEVDDAYQRMQLTIESTKKQLALEFAPASVAAMEAFSNAVSRAGQALEESRIVEYLAASVKGFTQFFGLASESEYVPDSNGMYGSNWYNPKTGLWEGNYSHRPMDDYFYDKESGRIWNLTKHQWVDDYSTEIWGHPNYQYSPSGSVPGAIYDRTRDRYYNASGNMNFVGGRTWVGENGPEEVFLPQGTQILNAQDTRNGVGGEVYYITVNVDHIEDLNALLRIVKDARIVGRMR